MGHARRPDQEAPVVSADITPPAAGTGVGQTAPNELAKSWVAVGVITHDGQTSTTPIIDGAMAVLSSLVGAASTAASAATDKAVTGQTST